MSFTTINLETLRVKSDADIAKNRKSLQSIFFNPKSKKYISKDRIACRVDVLDAKSLLDEYEDKSIRDIAPKFAHMYSSDEYNFGLEESMLNNCNLANINNISTIYSDRDAVELPCPYYRIIVSSAIEDIDKIITAVRLIKKKHNNRIFIQMPINQEFKAEEILSKLKKSIVANVDFWHIRNILNSMTYCAKIDFVNRENKRFLAEQNDKFFINTQLSLSYRSKDEETKVKEFFDHTVNFKKDIGFIKWAMIVCE